MVNRRDLATPFLGKTMRKKMRAFTLSLVLPITLAAVAACSAEGSVAETAASAEVSPPSALIAPGVLTVTADFQGPPFDYVEGTTKKGFDVEFDEMIARLLGVKLELVDTRFSSLIPSLQAGRADAAISMLYITQERLKTVDMVPYAQTGSGFLVKSDGDFQPKTAADLCGHKVAVLAGGFEEGMATGAINAECAASGSTLDVKSFPTDVEATQDVAAGRSDAFFTNFSIVSYRADEFAELNLAVSNPELLFPIPTGIAVSKDRPDTSRAMEQAVEKLIENGELEKLLGKFGLQLPDPALVEDARKGVLYK